MGQTVTITNKAKKATLARTMLISCISLVIICVASILAILQFSDASQSYTLTIYIDALESARTLIKGEPIGDLGVPEKIAHTFAGWFEDTECTKPFDTNTTIVKKNIILYAGWTRNTYTVSFIDPSGLNTFLPCVGVWGTPITFPTPEVSPKGCTFIEFSTNEYNTPNTQAVLPSQKIIHAAIPTQNVTYYIRWDNYAPQPGEFCDLIIRYDLKKAPYDLSFENDNLVSYFTDCDFATHCSSFTLSNLLGVNAWNNGYTSFSFGGWIAPDGKIYRDGSTVDLVDIIQNTQSLLPIDSEGRTIVEFSVFWNQYTAYTIYNLQ